MKGCYFGREILLLLYTMEISILLSHYSAACPENFATIGNRNLPCIIHELMNNKHLLTLHPMPPSGDNKAGSITELGILDGHLNGENGALCWEILEFLRFKQMLGVER